MGLNRDGGTDQAARLLGKTGCTCVPAYRACSARGPRLGTTVGWFCHHCSATLNPPRPQLDSFELQKGEIEACLDLAGRAIVISGWLAAVARRELARFKEFIAFIRHGKRGDKQSLTRNSHLMIRRDCCRRESSCS